MKPETLKQSDEALDTGRGFFLWGDLEKPQALLYAHDGSPLPLFLQEGEEGESTGEVAAGTFCDRELGILLKREERKTVQFVGSGRKSGLGSILSGDVGIINFGPQGLPVGETASFGLAGRPHFVEVSEERLAFQTHVAAAHPTDREGSGYSALWLEGVCFVEGNRAFFNCVFEGFRALDEEVLVFFGKGEKCVVAGSHKLQPQSLDRYEGPVQRVRFEGGDAGVEIEVAAGGTKMEVIPLAGDGSFWGADFMVIYSLTDGGQQFIFTLD